MLGILYLLSNLTTYICGNIKLNLEDEETRENSNDYVYRDHKGILRIVKNNHKAEKDFNGNVIDLKTGETIFNRVQNDINNLIKREIKYKNLYDEKNDIIIDYFKKNNFPYTFPLTYINEWYKPDICKYKIKIEDIKKDSEYYKYILHTIRDDEYIYKTDTDLLCHINREIHGICDQFGYCYESLKFLNNFKYIQHIGLPYDEKELKLLLYNEYIRIVEHNINNYKKRNNQSDSNYIAFHHVPMIKISFSEYIEKYDWSHKYDGVHFNNNVRFDRKGEK